MINLEKWGKEEHQKRSMKWEQPSSLSVHVREIFLCSCTCEIDGNGSQCDKLTG